MQSMYFISFIEVHTRNPIVYDNVYKCDAKQTTNTCVCVCVCIKSNPSSLKPPFFSPFKRMAVADRIATIYLRVKFTYTVKLDFDIEIKHRTKTKPTTISFVRF